MNIPEVVITPTAAYADRVGHIRLMVYEGTGQDIADMLNAGEFTVAVLDEHPGAA